MSSSITTPKEPVHDVVPSAGPTTAAPATRQPPVSDGSWGLLAVPMIICLFLMVYVIL